MSGRNGGLAPRLKLSQQLLVIEIMTLKRTASAFERQRLPTVEQLAYRFHISAGTLYRIASGRNPYKRTNPKDRPNYVPRVAIHNNLQEVSRS